MTVMDYIDWFDEGGYLLNSELYMFGMRFIIADGNIFIGDSYVGIVSHDLKSLHISEQHLLANVSDIWRKDLIDYIENQKSKRAKVHNVTCFNSSCIHYFEDSCVRNLDGEGIVLDENSKCLMFFKGVNKLYEYMNDDVS